MYLTNETINRDLALVLTHQCCNNCQHCSFGENSSAENELTTREVIAILEEGRRIGVTSINITGGEPFLRKDIFTIIDCIVGIGYKLSINTSGALLTEDTLRKLNHLRPNTVILSLDGHEGYHDSFRRNAGLYSRVVNAMEKISNEVKIIVSYVINNENYHFLPHVYEVVQNANAYMSVMPYNKTLYYSKLTRNLGFSSSVRIEEAMTTLNNLKRRDSRNLLLASWDYIAKIGKYLVDPCDVSTWAPCYAGYLRPQIDALGYVRLCFSLPPVGNVRQHSLQSILRGEECKKMLQRMERKHCPGCLITCFEKRNSSIRKSANGL